MYGAWKGGQTSTMMGGDVVSDRERTIQDLSGPVETNIPEYSQLKWNKNPITGKDYQEAGVLSTLSTVIWIGLGVAGIWAIWIYFS